MKPSAYKQWEAD